MNHLEAYRTPAECRQSRLFDQLLENAERLQAQQPAPTLVRVVKIPNGTEVIGHGHDLDEVKSYQIGGPGPEARLRRKRQPFHSTRPWWLRVIRGGR